MLKHMISSNSVVGNHHHHGNGGVHLGIKPGQRVGLNHSYHSANHLHRHLNVSTLSASKHSLGSVSPQPQPHAAPKLANGGLHLSPPPPPLAAATPAAPPPPPRAEAGVREMLTSLGLLCLISLLLALLSLIFLLKISPVTAGDVKDLLRTEQLTVISPDEYVVVYEVTLALCALSLSLNLCCLLVCSVQFLFAVKLVRDSPGGERTNKYLKKSAVTRVCAVGGFFVSIPVFLTGIILYTFIQFHSTPAIVTSVLIGLGIIFCGCAMVHNVFIWQKEKTNAVKALVQEQRLAAELKRLGGGGGASSSLSPSNVPHATLDLSSVATTPHELSTLV